MHKGGLNMYLIFDENTEKNQLTNFKSTQNYICFAFQNEISVNDFSDIETFRMYSDDDMFLREYTLEDYKLECNGNELYFKNKNEVIDLDALKADKIEMSKMTLAEWLENNPMTYIDGKMYSVTSEKQALLNGNLASYERAKAVGVEYPLKWNSTGSECTPWDYTDLLTLSLTIAGYVAPKVSKQQEIELQIKACTTLDELNEIVIDYDE